MQIQLAGKGRKKGIRFKKHIIIAILLTIFILNGFVRLPPQEIAYESPIMQDSNVEFLYDLTYDRGGKSVRDHQIFDQQLQLIKEAEDFIIIDMFLFNDDYKRLDGLSYPDLSDQLTSALINKKKGNPHIKILFITDEINNFYGAYESPYISRLKDNGIDVVITNLEKLRDSNPLYAGVWRSAIKWLGTAGRGWLPNPFSPDSPKVTLRAYLKLLNFKANHRKVIITDKAAIISSMNPHDASGNHSNIGFKLTGPIIEDLIETELAVAKLSAYKDIDAFNLSFNYQNQESNSLVSIITESKIRDKLISQIANSKKGERITMAIFYLSHRGIIGELIKAGKRGVDVRIILDANKDAFGIEKNGVPNRQAALEMVRKTNGNIGVRWYNTKGEQFHSKLTLIEKADRSIIIGGSANLTRRNLDDYNLETNVFIETLRGTDLDNDIKSYFHRIWTNTDADYTLDYGEYEDKSLLKILQYRIQEGSGLSSF